MFFKQIYDKGLAQASYLIGCQATNEAIVIDAQRDVDIYLKIAEQEKLNITHITETHIHADYLCGSRELAAATGAKMYLSAEGGPDWQYEFDNIPLKHEDVISVGNLSLKVLHTPGHTPESISFLLTDHPASDAPVMVFTGDFVFIGDIGRPDLLEKAAGLVGTQEIGAKQMYESLQIFADLPEYVQVWPAHGAGSACGKALGAVPNSTVGYEKIRNWAFQFDDDKEGFIKELLSGQPEPPKYFAMMKHLNKVNRQLLVQVPKHPKLSNTDFLEAYKNGLKIIDTREKTKFAKAHIPGSINIQANNSFNTWAGWFLDYNEQFVLVVEEEKVEEVTRKLMRIGLDNVYGYIVDPNELGIELEQSRILNDHKAFKEFYDAQSVTVVDIRSIAEFEAGHIDNAKHVFLGTIEDNLDQIPKDTNVIIHCQSGDRSAIAYSILKKNGYTNILNYTGGIKDWMEMGQPVCSL